MIRVQSTINGFIQWALADITTSPPTILHLGWTKDEVITEVNIIGKFSEYQRLHPDCKLKTIQIITKYSNNSGFSSYGYGGSDGSVPPPTPPISSEAFGQMAERYRKQFGTEKVVVPPFTVGGSSTPPEQPAPVPVN